MQVSKRFDWTDTLFTETAKQVVEDVLVDYHGIFARHRMDIGMNTKFRVKLTPKDDRANYNQSVPMPIHMKEDLTVDLALMHKYGIITNLPFSKYASQKQFLNRGTPKGICASLWFSGKSTPR